MPKKKSTRTSQAANPFKKAASTKKHLKVLFYGEAGSGKTSAALTFPDVAVVDSEHGTEMYSVDFDFDVVNIYNVHDLNQAVEFLQDNPDAYQTLVVDSISVIKDMTQKAIEQAKVKRGKGDDMSFREWAKLNNLLKRFYHVVSTVPAHVVIIARQSDEYEGEGNNMKRVGVKPDADKAIRYMMDIVIRIDEKHVGHVEKIRGGAAIHEFFKTGDRLKDISFENTFAALADFLDNNGALIDEDFDDLVDGAVENFEEEERREAEAAAALKEEEARKKAKVALLKKFKKKLAPDLLAEALTAAKEEGVSFEDSPMAFETFVLEYEPDDGDFEMLLDEEEIAEA